jgi:hypothetical protein
MTKNYKVSKNIISNKLKLTNVVHNSLSKLNIYAQTNRKTLHNDFEKNIVLSVNDKEYNIQLPVPMYGIELFRDYVDIINKKLYKKVSKRIINGSENIFSIQVCSTVVKICIKLDPTTNYISRNEERTIMYSKINGVKEVSVYNRDFNITLSKDVLSEYTENGVKSFLKENNLVIYYINKVYKEYDLDIEDINLVDGENEISINGTEENGIEIEYVSTVEPEEKIFKPRFCSVLDFVATPADAKGGMRYCQETLYNEDIEVFNSLKITDDPSILVVDCYYNEETDEMYLLKDKDWYVTNYASKYIDNGINIDKIKLHTFFYNGGLGNSEYIRQVIGRDKFKEKYDKILDDVIYIADNLRDKDGNKYIKDIILFNELDALFHDDELTDYVIDSVNKIKALGYNSGVSNASPLNFKNNDERLKEASSKFYINWYIKIQDNNHVVDIDKVVENVRNSREIKILEEFTKKYNKKVFISETGVLDDWEYLHCPTRYGFTNVTPSYGETENIYLNMMFKALNLDYIEGVCYWWYMGYNKLINPIQEYTK